MSIKKSSYAVMFADVSGSSRLYKQVGDAKAKSAIDILIAMMRDITEKNAGVVVKTIGDEVMACFKTCEDAALAARAMHRGCESQDTGHAISLRIGVDFGDVILDRKDFFGETVNSAAYVAHVAQAEQTVITANVRENLSKQLKLECEKFDKVTVKGAEAKTTLYHLAWALGQASSHSGRTQLADLPDITRKIGVKLLRLTYQDRSIELSQEQTPFIIGRSSEDSELCIDSDLASRDHCHILYRRGKFVLKDHSTNGTYVSQNNQQKIYLRREELPLIGAGEIIIGKEDITSPSDVIYYSHG